MGIKRLFTATLVGAMAVTACALVPSPAGPQVSPASEMDPRPRRRIAFKQPLAIDWDRVRDRDFLTEIAPRTLATGRRVLVGRQGTHATALSPDRELLLAAEDRGGYRIIEVDGMSQVGSFRTGQRGWPMAIRWPAEDRALVLRGMAQNMSIGLVDPLEGRGLRSTEVPGVPVRIRGAAGGLVALAQEYSIDGDHLPARLVVASRNGDVRSVTLERIYAGFSAGENDRFGRSLMPALATRGDEAFVIGTDGTIAVVELTTMRVGYPEPQLSLSERLSAALLPAAHAKFSEGRSLWARWVDDRYLALTGSRTDMRGRGDNLRMQTRCLPIRLLDTRDWSLRRWSGTGNGLEVIGGGIITFDRCADEDEPGGLTAYDGRGEVLWRSLPKKNISGVTVRAGLAFVRHGYKRVLRSVVDIRNGRVLTTRESFASILPY